MYDHADGTAVATPRARITAVADHKVELPFTPTTRYRCDRGHTWTGPEVVNLRGSDGLPRCTACFRELIDRHCGIVERECGRVTPMVG